MISYRDLIFFALWILIYPKNTNKHLLTSLLTCFVGGSHQWSAGCVGEAHITANFFPVGKPLWSDIFLHLNPKDTHRVRVNVSVASSTAVGVFTFRWRLVGCMYCPSVRQSTSASRNSVMTSCQKTVEFVWFFIMCVCVRQRTTHPS